MKRMTITILLTIMCLSAFGVSAADIDAAFEQFKQYDYTKPMKPLYEVERYLDSATKDAKRRKEAAAKLSAMLSDPKVHEGAKGFILRHFGLVADESHVPLLVNLLADPKVSDMARGALEDIPGDASLKALRDALGTQKGQDLNGVINSLGARRDAKAVNAIAQMLQRPRQRVAAARALGKIGTQEAAAALGGTHSCPVIQDAQLRCAERMLADGNSKGAEKLYQKLCGKDVSEHIRVAGLSGLVEVNGEKAVPYIMDAVESDIPFLKTTALRLAGKVEGKKMSGELANLLNDLKPESQALLIDVLVDCGDSSVSERVMKMIDSKDESVKLAAVKAMGSIGDGNSIEKLALIAAGKDRVLQEAARGSLARISGDGAEKAMIKGVSKGSAECRIELIKALGSRTSEAAAASLMKAAADKDEDIRKAALSAIGQAGEGVCYEGLVRMMAKSEEPERVVTAAQLVGGRVGDKAKCAGPVLDALKSADNDIKPHLYMLLSSFGGRDALKVVTGSLQDKDKDVVDGAARALANWQDISASNAILDLAGNTKNKTYRVLAWRGYFRLVETVENRKSRLKMITNARKVAMDSEAKRLLLSALISVSGDEAQEIVSEYLDDRDVSAEAEQAMNRLLGVNNGKALVYNAKRSASRKAHLAKKTKDGAVICYLDCGPDTKDGAKKGPSLKLISGKQFEWAGSGTKLLQRYGTISFGSQVVFEATSLDGKKFYKVGFSWWDYDHDDRVVSVQASGSGKNAELLKGTKLPSYAAGKNRPEEKELVIPQELCNDGKVTITFKLESGANATVSELWLIECKNKPAGAAAVKTAAAGLVSPRKKDMTNVLIVTGVDYPGHKWKQTCPVLKKALEKDRRFEVMVTEDPHQLASEKIHEYDVIVLHFQDHKVPSPGKEARENFKKFVKNGGGVVVVHFACGAWQDWPEFVEIAGRVWNPKFRGHDPHGKFTVEIVDVKHPITKGMKPFETTDELYTCLDGKTEIRVLAEAKSKVDKKIYPIAFVLNYGEGRIFHSPLGHDVKAFEADGVQELFRRGTAWSAGEKIGVVEKG